MPTIVPGLAPIAALLVIVAEAPPGSAAVGEPEALASTTPWTLDVEPESCTLVRGFGTGASRITLQLEAFAIGDGYSSMIVGAPAERSPATAPLVVRFLPDGQPATVEPIAARRVKVLSNGVSTGAIVFHADLAGRKVAHSGQVLRPLSEAALARIDGLALDVGSSGHYRLQLGPMLAPIKALRGCVDGMVRRWGFDPTVVDRPGGRPEPVGRPGDWATDNDLPPGAIARRIEADVHFRLTVDPAGRVSDCVVQDRAPSPTFSELTCRLMRERARFRPALGSTGQPVASWFVSTVRWRVPQR